MNISIPSFSSLDQSISRCEPDCPTTFNITKLNLPSGLAIASNMLGMDDSTYIVELNEDGSFNKTEKLCGLAPDVASRSRLLLAAKSLGWPIKVENMEDYNQEIYQTCVSLNQVVNLPVNAHLFVGFEGRGSFGWHSDDGHVFCYMIEGVKHMRTEKGDFTLSPGSWLFMPKGLRHCAHNLTDTVMMSFGTYEWWGNNPHVLE